MCLRGDTLLRSESPILRSDDRPKWMRPTDFLGDRLFDFLPLLLVMLPPIFSRERLLDFLPAGFLGDGLLDFLPLLFFWLPNAGERLLDFLPEEVFEDDAYGFPGRLIFFGEGVLWILLALFLISGIFFVVGLVGLLFSSDFFGVALRDRRLFLG